MLVEAVIPLTMEARHLLKQLKDDGWYLGDTEGASRQYIHRDRPEVITVCVRYTDELTGEAEASALAPGPPRSEADPEVVLEETGTGFVAYSPDLPGCVATGQDEADARARLAAAMELHLRGLGSR